jgi:hypothetical protein
MRPLRTLMNPHELAITSMRQSGGAGGNRTPVRKPSTDSSTYLAVLFDLTYYAPTSKQEISELP